MKTNPEQIANDVLEEVKIILPSTLHADLILAMATKMYVRRALLALSSSIHFDQKSFIMEMNVLFLSVKSDLT